MKRAKKLDGIWYLLDIDTQESTVIKSQDDEYSGKIIIPTSFFYEGIIYSVTTIGEQAFRLCSRLYSIVIPDSVIKVEPKAFEGCFELSEVHINSIESWCNIEFCGPYSNPLVNSWEESYVRNITNLYIKGEFVTELTIPGTITTIKDGTFEHYWNLTSVIIHEGVTTIGEYAFHSCHQLTSVIMPNSIVEIREGVFKGCSNLASITIPEGVTTISERAFEDCRNLTTIDISIGVKNIGESAFEDCRNLVSVIGGKNIKNIGDYAFTGCESLSSFDISDNVETIGNCAFYNCLSLGVVIPPKLRSIGKMAFYRCTLKSIAVPKSLTAIDSRAFKDCFFDCKSLEICVEQGNPKYDSRNKCNAIIETNSNTLIVGCATTNIPNSVISIGDEAFSDCDNLISITIPNGVKYIGRESFANCYKLRSITIPGSVIGINGSAFSNCFHLECINIDNLESWCKIDFTGGAFCQLREYKTATFLHIKGKIESKLQIPTTITEIKSYAFCGFYVEAVIIPQSITSIGDYAFWGTYLESITIPNSVKSIEKGAFGRCNLNYVVLPKNVKLIDEGAFSVCNNMTYVTILGSPVIMKGAFRKCSSLQDLYCYGDNIPEVHNAFEGLDISKITLHVPSNAIEEYKNKEPWCRFCCILPIE